MIGKYERFSPADGDLELRDGDNSIQHQRSLIDEYLASKAEFLDAEAEEFVDEGYSGRNFDRPGFQKVMEGVKSGRIDTIIVKDFTRFGRETAEVGKYLEQIFPILGIRFIAINNNYDSSVYYSGKEQGMDQVVGSLAGAFRQRDAGKRLRDANEEKWKRGYSTSGSAPFGYVQDPERKGRYVLDPPAAQIVRKIFNLALEGRTTSQIAHCLNEEGIPIASEYNRTHGIQGKARQYSLTPDKIWNAGKVWKILTTYEYTGAMVLGKSRVIVPGRTVVRRNAPGDQYITENVHEAIVTHEEFERAQGVIQYRSKGEYLEKKEFPLRSKIRCGHCHRVMAHDLAAAEPVVWCRDGREMPRYSHCPSGQYSLRRIEKQVFQALREWLELLEGARESLETAGVKLEALGGEALGEMVSGGQSPEGGTLGEAVPGGEAPGRRMPGEAVPGEKAPGGEAPSDQESKIPAAVARLLVRVPELLEEETLTKEAVRLTIDRVYIHGGEDGGSQNGDVEVRFRYEKEIQDFLEISS